MSLQAMKTALEALNWLMGMTGGTVEAKRKEAIAALSSAISQAEAGEAIPDHAAKGANGVVYHNIEGIYHKFEEAECLHMWLDREGAPRADEAGAVFSLVGRVMRIPTHTAAVQAALEAAAKACEGERLTDDLPCDADKAYNQAIGHCAAAIRALKPEDVRERK